MDPCQIDKISGQFEFRLVLFGAPKLEWDSQPVRLPTRKSMALLIFLAMTGEEQSRERLSTLFWPDQDERRARASLRQSLSFLRKILGPELLRTSGDRVMVHRDSGLYVDACAYLRLIERCPKQPAELDDLPSYLETLTRAVALYSGAFLDGFTLPDCPQFDEWRFFQAETLRRSLDGALSSLIRWHRRERNYETAIGYARRRLLLDPLHEPAQRDLMELYALAGRHAAALRQYHECVRILHEELQVPPEPETIALYESIRRQRLTAPADAIDGRVGEAPPGEALELEQRGSAPAPASGGLGTARDTLPPQPTPFVGREDDLSAILSRLQDPACRLLTIVGPGGMGKTRLAIACAQRLLDGSSPQSGFAHGIVFVPLQGVRDESGVVAAVADAVGFHFYSEKPPREQLIAFLRQKQILLVLDTFEHLLATVDLVVQCLMAAPGLKILATSRVALRLRQEWFYPLGGMHVPDHPLRPGEDVSTCDAVRLFEQCGRRAQPHFQLAQEQEHVLRICQLVDGMPLGIELAAAWLKVLTGAQIAGEIERGLDILSTLHQDMPPRHRSMRVLFDSSWDMLSKDEQDALKRLSVFRGEFSRAAAREVTGVSLPTMAALVEKSLLQTVHRGYYQMHELLRQYSAERLQEQRAEEEEICERHADFYCDYLERQSAALTCSGQQNALLALSHERGNLQSAWERATAQRNLAQIDRAMDGLGRYYEWTGNLTGGAAAYALIGDDPGYLADWPSRRTQAHALAWAANFERMSGRTEVAEEQLARSQSLLDELDAAGVDVRRQRALAQLHRGHLLQPSNLDAAAHAYRRSGDEFQEMGLRWEAATAYAGLGETARVIGHTGQAIALLRRAQTIFDQFGDQRSVAMVLENIARAYLLDRADLTLALETAQASLELRRASGDRVGIATTLLTVSYVHCWLNQPTAAKPLMEEALAIARDLGHRAVECEALYIAMVVFNYLEAPEQKRA
ncbi:MAG: hypothetical protein KDD83_07860, partial [Caldilineaceae bacterium]|nr:hypothetical protein [Caldilineaceae bacterium]